MEDHLTSNPWISIWFHPRKTIREIVSYNWNHHFYFLSAVYGFSLLFGVAQNFSLGQIIPLKVILVFVLICAVFLGYLGITVTGAALCWTGKWIGGKGSFNDIRAAVAWSNVPNAIQILLWLVLIAIFGAQVFDQRFPDTTFSGAHLIVVIALLLAQAVLGVWSFLILLNTLGEVQGFSAWKALLNIFIPIGMLIVIIWVLGLFVS